MSYSGLSNSNPQVCPSSYVAFLKKKPPAPSKSYSFKSLKKLPAVFSFSTYNSLPNHNNTQFSDYDHNATLNTLLQEFNELKNEICTFRTDIIHFQ